jgi:hypothetical protein
MAARRLLIVMLVLLGLSTLAAALVPQRTLREDGTTSTTTTQATTTPAPTNPAFLRPTKILVGGKKFPVVSPIHVGDQLRLLVYSRIPAQISIPEFGLVGFASSNTPARFELLAQVPGKFGILFADPGAVPDCRKVVEKGSPCVAGQIEVLAPAGSKPAKKAEGKRGKAKSRARGGSGRA